MKTAAEMKDHLIERASEDEDFRDSLMSDPKSSIENELGITIPSGVTVRVHENTVNKVHLVLPRAPRLGEAELEAVAGGRCSDGCCSEEDDEGGNSIYP